MAAQREQVPGFPLKNSEEKEIYHNGFTQYLKTDLPGKKSESNKDFVLYAIDFLRNHMNDKPVSHNESEIERLKNLLDAAKSANEELISQNENYKISEKNATERINQLVNDFDSVSVENKQLKEAIDNGKLPENSLIVQFESQAEAQDFTATSMRRIEAKKDVYQGELITRLLSWAREGHVKSSELLNSK